MITFIGMSSRTSGMTRGMQLVPFIPGSNFVNHDQFNQAYNVTNKIVIFIRQFDPNIAQFLRRNGHIIGFDVLDRPVANAHNEFKQGRNDICWEEFAHHEIDFYVVNNTLCKEKIDAIAPKKSKFVIPHQAVNFELMKNKVKENVEIIGYIGLKDQLVDGELIQAFCEKHGIKFISVHPNTREECLQSFKQIDVGVVSMNSEGYRDFVLKYKPNVKLTNFQSFGIPTTASCYASFEEFGGNFWLKSKDCKETIMNLEELIRNVHLRHTLSNSGFEWAKQFHIGEIAKKFYGEIINEFK